MLVIGFKIYVGSGSVEEIWDDLKLDQLISSVLPKVKRKIHALEGSEFFDYYAVRARQYFVKSGMMQFDFPFPIAYIQLPDQFRSVKFRVEHGIEILVVEDN